MVQEAFWNSAPNVVSLEECETPRAVLSPSFLAVTDMQVTPLFWISCVRSLVAVQSFLLVDFRKGF